MNCHRSIIALGDVAWGIVALCALLTISGCHKTPDTAASQSAVTNRTPVNATVNAAEGAARVSLKPEEMQRMGIVTTQARSMMHLPEAIGFAVVLAHESIATALAEFDTAQAAEHQSRAALERTRRLVGTPGAMPADTLEGLERQAAVDRVALELSHRKLSAVIGQNSPWRYQLNNPRLQAVANGDSVLVRISFPLGSIGDTVPRSLRLARINATQGGKSIETHSVWSAAADAVVPGRSFLAYMKTSEFVEGEHLLAWIQTGESQAGVWVPQSAVIITAGKYWCYIEEKKGQFVRAELDPSVVTTDGYFVNAGIEAGAKIVTGAAGQLLAREINPGTAVAD